MKNKVLNYIRENKMIEAGESVVIGVSGGADSMCLLHIMEEISSQMGLKLAVVHIHHGIRKETADRDAEFVANYCKQRGIACYVKRFDVPALSKEWGMSDEEAGRKVRYDAFSDVLNDMLDGASKGKIAVAHNADDSAETVLLNLFRGTGIKGMSGILPIRGNVIRPVLCLTRQEIEEYNELHNIVYIHDETNFQTEYTRNKLRLDILPAIKESINRRASEHINMAGQSLAEIDEYMELECDKLFKQIVMMDTNENGVVITVKTQEYLMLHKAMRILLVKKCLYTVAEKAKDISRRHMISVQELFEQEVGKCVNLPYSMVATKSYDGVIIRKHKMSGEAEKAKSRNEVLVSGEGVFELEIGNNIISLTVEKGAYCDEIFNEYVCTKWIDCDIMDCNLLLRTRRDGDYIIIDDKGSRKKLKDFFIDKKVPREERDHICLLARGNEIIWIVGHRLNASYRVNKDTKNIMKLRVEYREEL